jgi:PTH2 family peptidyl-tRNA hydrolase
MSDIVKQVIVLRKDLNMRKGKMVAQGAHASMAVLLNRGDIESNITEDNKSYVIELNDDIQEWLTGRFTKICVSVNSVEHLLLVHNAAEQAGIPCSLIQDAGLTEFDGVPTFTAVAIGPAKASKIDKITGELKLL